ncbi:2'-5' RNA ligase family protein [Granulicella tundricola]|uniref:Phosphoesterase HXTX n=1 Tax=Granulicella tundricola (strain ATCC BAA-1859 / DSM 23138 / MP5ACTX9) TaxID=1198114 RepID=E8X3F3_GRATM|nr:2'-5' RNA ligase family protein [Granulicella tundricola]ADW70454.1 hypothetical protein AciX9_3449 [Granulicella tundricola MP5ACTX9]
MEAQVAAHSNASYILTLALDPASQDLFDRLRKAHYPPKLNQIAAHLTLFHKLPQTEAVQAYVASAAVQESFTMRVTGLRSLGRGVAYSLHSDELQAIHRQLSTGFAEHLTAQDKQKFWPHVVVQNKASGEEARELKLKLELEFREFDVQATGLQLWRYLGGPWELAATYTFSS